jgi:hypothetical protein
MKTKIIASALLLATASLTLPTQASPLSDLIEQHQLSWLLGSWATADGQVKLVYEYRLEKNIIGVNFKAGDRESEGMIALKPGTQESLYVSVDSQGSVSKGAWKEHEGNPLLKTTINGQEGEIKIASEHINVDSNTMRVKVYKQNDSGDLGEVMVEVELKRAK